MGKNNIIEINGKRYNTKTGELLAVATHHAVAHHQSHNSSATAAKKPVTPKPIPVHHAAANKTVHAQPPKSKPAPKHRVHDAIRQVSKKPAIHRPQPAKTLMRSAVKKPAASLKRHTKAHGHTDALLEKPAAKLQPKASARRLDSQRLKHAQHVPKSKLVSRFNAGPATLSFAQPSVQVPVVITPAIAQPALHTAPAVKPRPHAAKKPADRTTVLLERALQNATSHLEPAPPKAKKFRLSLSRKHARA